jgi:RNA polymerase primary sigma factor
MRQLKITQKITNRDSDSISKYFTEVNKIPLLTDTEEIELAYKVSQGDEVALSKLVESNLRFVISVAKQYQNRGLPLQDIINDGNFGLMKAAKKFDNNRGFKFISYAVWWIRQAIMQSLAEQSRMIRVPSNQMASVNKVNRAISKLEQTLEREPTDMEIQNSIKEFEGLDLKVKELRQVIGRTVSLECPTSEEDGALTLLDYIPNIDSISPDFNLNKESMKSDFEKVLSKLTPRQKSVVCMYFGLLGKQTMTLEEIGENLDLTRERVRQIKDGALRTLKCRGNSSILKQYFNA